MKIYTAALYSRMMDMRRVKEFLEFDGHEVTAQWVDGGEEGPNGRSLVDAAYMDVDDVARADVLIFFAQPYGSANRGGGRHWEFGYAYALEKRCIVVGEKETVFCHLRNVEVYSNLTEAREALRGK